MDPELKDILKTTGDICICWMILLNNSLNADFLRCGNGGVVVKNNGLVLERHAEVFRGEICH